MAFPAAGSEAEIRFSTMRTMARIAVVDAPNPDQALAAARDAVLAVERLMAPAGDSDVGRLNRAAAGEWVSVDPLTWTVAMAALRYHRLSGGAFDPTVGALKPLFHFADGPAEWPSEEALREARRRVGADKLLYEREGMRLAFREAGMRLDLGAVAKGFAVDRAAEALIKRGGRNVLVDIGGELRLLGRTVDPATGEPRPWRTAIRRPRDDGGAKEVMPLTDCAVASSGDYEQYFEFGGKRWSHILDPRTGLPVTGGVVGVTVIHPRSCLEADALATTLSVLGEVEGKAFVEARKFDLFSDGVTAILWIEEGDGLRRVEIAVPPSRALRKDVEHE